MPATRRRGFTLVEMLVVIGIIVLLMAILFPVFGVVREKAKETQCFSNLHQLTTALKAYRDDHGRYPGLPYFDTTAQRYHGGFSDLYPDYIDSTKVLVCPEDTQGRLVTGNNSKVYSTYNGKVDPSTWVFTEIYYNYDGYDVTGTAPTCTSTGVDQPKTTPALAKAFRDAVMSEFATRSITWRDAPMLSNRSAPGFTIITHCPWHRKTGDAGGGELVQRADGDAKKVTYGSLCKDPDGAGPKVAPFISQLQ